jgi:pimeloyl-ACP methyl ester carboxylesterase
MTSPTAVDVTAGYYGGAGLGLRLFRLALGASQRVWPGLAVRAAGRLFRTPLPLKWLQRRGGWEHGWRVEAWPFEGANVTVYRPAAAPHAPLALLVHGWGGQARQMLPLAEALAARGLKPVLLEMPAHGRSAGTASNLPQFARAIDYAVARLRHEGESVRVLAAHSMGANAAAYATARALPVDRLVLLAPPASPRNYTRYFAQVFGLSERTRAAMQQLIEAREGVLMPQFEPAAVGPRLRLPVLVVHDREDRINDFADAEAYERAIEHVQLIATQGLGHRRILKDEAVLAAVASFATSQGA